MHCRISTITIYFFVLLKYFHKFGNNIEDNQNMLAAGLGLLREMFYQLHYSYKCTAWTRHCMSGPTNLTALSKPRPNHVFIPSAATLQTIERCQDELSTIYNWYENIIPENLTIISLHISIVFNQCQITARCPHYTVLSFMNSSFISQSKIWPRFYITIRSC